MTYFVHCKDAYLLNIKSKYWIGELKAWRNHTGIVDISHVKRRRPNPSFPTPTKKSSQRRRRWGYYHKRLHLRWMATDSNQSGLLRWENCTGFIQGRAVQRDKLGAALWYMYSRLCLVSCLSPLPNLLVFPLIPTQSSLVNFLSSSLLLLCAHAAIDSSSTTMLM